MIKLGKRRFELLGKCGERLKGTCFSNTKTDDNDDD